MEDRKWLRRKYPDSFKELDDYFDRHELRDFKKSTRKIGRLTKDIVQGQKYKKGTVIEFRKSSITEYNHPYVYCIVKCQLGYTESGYHSFNITEQDFKEITS